MLVIMHRFTGGVTGKTSFSQLKDKDGEVILLKPEHMYMFKRQLCSNEDVYFVDVETREIIY